LHHVPLAWARAFIQSAFDAAISQTKNVILKQFEKNVSIESIFFKNCNLKT
jgi:hypothetical protein